MSLAKKALVTDPSMIRFADLFASSLPQVEWHFLDSADDEELRDAIGDVEVYVGYRLTPAMALAGRQLQLVQVSGTGVDEISFETLRSGVSVTNTYRHERSIAEYVVMVLVALSRQLLVSDAHLRGGVWDSVFHGDVEPYQTLRGKVLGLVGFGHIGRETAHLCRPFGLEIMAIKRNPDAELAREHGLAFLGGIEQLDHILTRSDFVVLALPLTSATRGLLGARELALMKSTACLINVARAELVDEAALYEALSQRRIAGAALDVWYRYPSGVSKNQLALPASHPFHMLENVIITPHSSGNTDETFRLRAVDAIENIRRLLTGEELKNVVLASGSSAVARSDGT